MTATQLSDEAIAATLQAVSELPEPLSDEEEMAQMQQSLTQEQRDCMELINAGENVFISGNEDNGAILNMLKQTCTKNLVCLSATGRGAQKIGGVVLADFCDVPEYDLATPEKLSEPTPKQRDIYKAVDIVYIHDISRVRSDEFWALVKRLKDAAGFDKKVQFIVCGSFYVEYPPLDVTLITCLDETHCSLHAFGTTEWNDLNFKYLDFKKRYCFLDPYALHDLMFTPMDKSDYIKTQKQYEACVRKEYYFSQHQAGCDCMYCTPDEIEPECISMDCAPVYMPKDSTKSFQSVDINTCRQLGEFSSRAQPTHFDLEIKSGMKVMFVGRDKDLVADGDAYVEGDIGTVYTYNPQPMVVVNLVSGRTVVVREQVWVNYKYDIEHDDNNKASLVLRKAGEFRQLPIIPISEESFSKFDLTHKRNS